MDRFDSIELFIFKSDKLFDLDALYANVSDKLSEDSGVGLNSTPLLRHFF